MKPDEITLVGVGTAGSRAAYYIYQRGSINGVRVLALDSDKEALAMLPNVDALQAPPQAEFMDGTDVSREGSQFVQAFKQHIARTKLMVAVTCLGRGTGNFYTRKIVELARKNEVKTAVIAAMPHAFDAPAWHAAATECLDRLKFEANTVLPLPCSEFGTFFPEQLQNEAYPQAVRWIAETAIGFVSLFTGKTTEGKTSRPVFNPNDNQLYLVFKDQPRGIFYMSKPSVYNGENLDVPTFFRKNIAIDDGK